MELVFEKHIDMRDSADALVVPCWKQEGGLAVACLVGEIQEKILPVMDLGDFGAKEQELSLLYDWNQKEQRILLVGLGAEGKVTLETIRRAYAEAIKYGMGKKWKSINIMLPTHAEYSPNQIAYAAAEAALMTNYRFDYMSAKLDKKPALIEKICVIADGCDANQILQETLAIAKGSMLIKNLVNGNADDITPKFLSQQALELGKRYKDLHVTVFDKEEIVKRKMGLLYAVSKGAKEDPYFIVMQYKGNPSSSDHTVFIGKGITYDTGGLSLKPTNSMETMRCDMAGAATVIGVLATVAELKLPINVSCVVPATENGIDASSYKIGDVYTGYSGTTVEIKNTDAEGRLVLADALAYTVDLLAPSRIIDLATLTGAAEIALGSMRSPFFSTDDTLASQLFEVGEEVGERLWLMPLDSDYRELITSRIADIKNSGAREGSLIFSAMFLKEFVGNIPWAHVDIAGTAFLEKPRYYHTTSATAYGLRLLIQYLKKFHVSK